MLGLDWSFYLQSIRTHAGACCWKVILEQLFAEEMDACHLQFQSGHMLEAGFGKVNSEQQFEVQMDV